MLVFQYGSNCLESQINSDTRLQGDARFIAIARTVDDFVISFDVWSNGRSCAAANIVPHPGSKVWGALYEIPDYLLGRETAKVMSRKSLDAIEGRSYQRGAIKLYLPDHRIITGQTYRVREPKAGLKTSSEYVGYILRGLRERGVPADYIVTVKEAAVLNNAAIASQLGDF